MSEIIEKTVKLCNKCYIGKEYSEFYKLFNSKDGLQYYCKTCQHVNKNDNRKKNPEQYLRVHREWKLKNRERLNGQNKEYRAENKEKRNEYNRKWRKKNAEKYSIARKRQREKYKNSYKHKLDARMSALITESFKINKSKKNNRSWKTMISYSLDDLEKHIKSHFIEGMNWEKYVKGEVQIDHILPRELFEYQTPKDIRFQICWSLDNLKPIWKTDNVKKQDKLLDGRLARNLSSEEKIKYLESLGYNLKGNMNLCQT